jgi:hypothetical protein
MPSLYVNHDEYCELISEIAALRHSAFDKLFHWYVETFCLGYIIPWMHYFIGMAFHIE